MAATTLAVAGVAASAYSANRQKKSADKASRAQVAAADAGIDEQRRQFDAVQQLLAPYVKSGTDATDAQRAFLGLAGPDAERAAIDGVRNSETFPAAAKEGENAILQNAAATGGLRGGNTQAALARFRPNLLNQLIAQRFAGLDLLASRGQASAAGQAAAAQNTGAAVSGLLQEQGAAIAGAQLARGNANAQLVNGILQAGSTLAGYRLNRPQNPGGVVSTPPGATPPFVGPR